MATPELQKPWHSVRVFFLALLPAWVFALSLLLATQVWDATQVFLAINQFSHDVFKSFLPEQWASSWSQAVWVNLTMFGDASLLLALLSGHALRQKQKDLHVYAVVMVALLGVAIVSPLAKVWLGAMRPAASLSADAFYAVGALLFQKSMPSGHTMTVFAVASALWATYLVKAQVTGISFGHRLEVVLIFSLAFLVGISRIAVGAHWAHDVAVGAMAGSLLAYTAMVCVHHTQSGAWLQKQLQRTWLARTLVLLAVLAAWLGHWVTQDAVFAVCGVTLVAAFFFARSVWLQYVGYRP